jgi:hypothetical protein
MRRPDDEHAEERAAHAIWVDDDEDDIRSWEAMVWATRGRMPFSALMDYTLALWVWPWVNKHPGEQITIPTAPLCLIGLAGYGIASSQGIYEVDRVPLEAVAVLLANDDQARQLIEFDPGLDTRPDGRLRDVDRRALTDAVRPDSKLLWDEWREQARQAVQEQTSPHYTTTFLVPGQKYLHALSIRRGWYDHPELPFIEDREAD